MEYEGLEEATNKQALSQPGWHPRNEAMAPPAYEQSLEPLPPVEGPSPVGPPPPTVPPPVTVQPYHLGSTPITGQPSQPAVNVLPVYSTMVVNQALSYGQTYPQNIRDWSTGLCNCCDHMGVCVYGLCCPCCQACSVANRMNENGFCIVCCIPGGEIAMRTKYRTLHGIRGDIVDDFCAMCCCYPCAICQMAREQSSAPY